MMKLLRGWPLRKYILDIIKSLIWLINGLEKGSSGTIYIPTKQDLIIENDDIVIEETPTLSIQEINNKTVKFIDNVSVEKLTKENKNVEKEFSEIYQDNSIMKYRVVSVDDNRKGNLQHFKIFTF